MNAADQKQVRTAKHQERRRAEQQRSDLKTVLALPEGRRMFTALLTELRPPENLWHPNAAAMGFNAARYDVATRIEQDIDEADPEALVKMAVERRAQQKADMDLQKAHDTKRIGPETLVEGDEDSPAD